MNKGISLSLIDSDRFLEMPSTAQALYFHLAIRADEKGYVKNTRAVMRMLNCSEGDYEALTSKGFVHPIAGYVVLD